MRRSLDLLRTMVPKHFFHVLRKKRFIWVSLVISINCDMTIILHPVHGIVSLNISIQMKTCLTARRNVIRSDSL